MVIAGIVSVAALVVSIVALAVGGGALVFTRRADKRDSLRLKREDADALASQEARMSAARLPRSTSNSHSRAYRFRVTNRGKADARDLQATLIDEHGNVVSELVDNGYGEVVSAEPYYLKGGFLQSREPIDFEIAVQEAARDSNPLFLHFSWIDDSAPVPREHTSRTEIPSN